MTRQNYFHPISIEEKFNCKKNRCQRLNLNRHRKIDYTTGKWPHLSKLTALTIRVLQA